MAWLLTFSVMKENRDMLENARKTASRSDRIGLCDQFVGCKSDREGRAGEAGEIVNEHLLVVHQLVEMYAGTFTHNNQNFLMNSMAIESMNGSGRFIDLLAS